MERINYFRQLFPQFGPDWNKYSFIKLALKRSTEYTNTMLKTVAHYRGRYYKIYYYINVYSEDNMEYTYGPSYRVKEEIAYAAAVCMECHKWHVDDENIYVIGKCICNPKFSPGYKCTFVIPG